MPRLPIIPQNVGLPRAPGVRYSPDDFGAQGFEALGQLGQVFGQIQEQDDKSEARRIIAETKTSFAGAVQLNAQQIADPDEFLATTTKQLDEAKRGALESAKNPRVKRLINDAIATEFDQAGIKVNFAHWNKKKDRVLANFADEEKALTEQAASQDDNIQREAYKTYGQRVGELRADGFMDAEAAQKRLVEFRKGALTRMANNEIEADASLFLRNLGRGKFDELDVDKRLSLRRAANAAVTTALEVQKREQAVKKEAADREIQFMFDTNVSNDVILEKLKSFSLAGVIDRQDRSFWESKLVKEEKAEYKETPAQQQNAFAFKADFDEQGYPNMGAVAKARERLRAMRNTGEIGVKSYGELHNMLNRTEQALRAEGRAIDSAARAAQGAQRAQANQDKPAKMSEDAALRLLQQNYNYGTARQPIAAQHKKDVQEFTQRTLIGGEDREKVAKEIFERSKQAKDTAQEQRQKAAEAAKTNPAAASILERLKMLKTQR